MISTITFEHGVKTCAMEEEIDDLKYELGVAREAQQCECSSDDACRFARERDALKDDIEKLHSVMMAAAVEITSHWDAHCDAEGFGPVNLVRRLENGFPSRYGYDAQTLIRVEAQRDALASSDAALREELGNVKAGLEHYRNLWSEVCDSEQGLRNELAALQHQEPVQYRYLFSNPLGGQVWRDSANEWNGNRPIKAESLYAAAGAKGHT